jgi:hypothetical protein
MTINGMPAFDGIFILPEAAIESAAGTSVVKPCWPVANFPENRNGPSFDSGRYMPRRRGSNPVSREHQGDDMKTIFIAAALLAGTPALAQDAMPAAPAAAPDAPAMPAAPAAPAAAPAPAFTPTPVDSASLPTCSKKIQDRCINAGAAGVHKATAVHKKHHKVTAKTTTTTTATTTPQ